MKHVVVGGDGFLGRQLVRDLLAKGDEVVVVDINKNDLDIYGETQFVRADIAEPSSLEKVPLAHDDVVHHLATKLIVPNHPRKDRGGYFWSCIYDGTENLLDFMLAKDCPKMVYWSTDMVYGRADYSPRDEGHPRKPLGPYGIAKTASEDLCVGCREKGMEITIFRPRLIIGPGRLGTFEKLFKLIDNNLPVPLIGSGSNRFQFASMFDCSAASIRAVEAGVPNGVYNLGSAAPPMAIDLVNGLIRHANSRSFIVKTPAGLVKGTLIVLSKLGIGLMDPEQFLIADDEVSLDITKAKEELGWEPVHSDEAMLCAAYTAYKERSSGRRSEPD